MIAALLTLAGGYLAAGLYLRAIQERMLFPAPHIPAADLPKMAAIAGATELAVPSGGEMLYGWHRRAGGERVVLYFHGNGSSAPASVLPMRLANAAGWDFVCVSPRSYPGSSGAPSPGFLAEDARAAWQYVIEELGFPPETVVLHGRSLGGGMVGTLLGEVAPAGVVIESSFRSMAVLVQEKIRVFPMGLILKYPLRTEERASSLSAPALILHGDADTMIPVHHGRALARAFSEATYVEVPGKGHNDGLLTDPDAAAAFRAWLDARR